MATLEATDRSLRLPFAQTHAAAAHKQKRTPWGLGTTRPDSHPALHSYIVCESTGPESHTMRDVPEG